MRLLNAIMVIIFLSNIATIIFNLYLHQWISFIFSYATTYLMWRFGIKEIWRKFRFTGTIL
jgi:hypothetical protein